MIGIEGIRISGEGIPGCGKSTQMRMLAERINRDYPNIPVVSTREPGGTEISEAIRTLVQGTKFNEEMEPLCEALLYAAARAQSLRKIKVPEYGIAIFDRTADTSTAYQGFGRGLGAEVVMEVNRLAVADMIPNISFLINLDYQTSLSRASDKAGDKFESMGKEFFDKAAAGYLWLAEQQKNRFVVIDGRGDVKSIHEQIYTVVKDRYLN